MGMPAKMTSVSRQLRKNSKIAAPSKRDDLPQEGDETVGNGRLQQTHIIRQARNKLARAPIGIKTERQPLQMRVHRDANIGHRPFAHIGQRQPMDKAKQRLHNKNGQQRRRQLVQPG